MTILQKIKHPYFGKLCEALIVCYLPRSVWQSREKDPYSKNYDIRWKRIGIEIKGSRKTKYGYTFSQLYKDNYTSISSKYHEIDRRKLPDVYVFVGWDINNIKVWVISRKKMNDVKYCNISENSKMNVFEVKDLRDISKSIQKEYEY